MGEVVNTTFVRLVRFHWHVAVLSIVGGLVGALTVVCLSGAGHSWRLKSDAAWPRVTVSSIPAGMLVRWGRFGPGIFDIRLLCAIPAGIRTGAGVFPGVLTGTYDAGLACDTLTGFGFSRVGSRHRDPPLRGGVVSPRPGLQSGGRSPWVAPTAIFGQPLRGNGRYVGV